MKLSKRERILIIILLLVVIIFAAYKFVPFDKIFRLEQLMGGYNQTKTKFDTMTLNILSKSDYEERFEKLSDEINNSDVISDLQQEKVMVFINSCLEKNGIDSTSVSFSEITLQAININSNQNTAKPESTLDIMMDEINGGSRSSDSGSSKNSSMAEEDTSIMDEPASETEQAPQETVKKLSVDIGFESSYEEMLSFIDAIQENSVDISITNINTVTKPDGKIQGLMTLNFYEVPKLNGYVEENSDWIWKDLFKSGKVNPYSFDSAMINKGNKSENVDSNIAEQKSDSDEGKFDFYVSLKSETSDIPTVVIGKAEDETRSTYVYADSNNIENIEFKFKKENSKYYYSYSTATDDFPNDGSWKEFTPVDSKSVNIKVYSSERSSDWDSAGANISVVNTSSLKVAFEIEYDDKTKPRAYFKDPKSVSVIRK